MALRVIVNMSDAKGTSFTLQNISVAEVMAEYEAAMREHRLMNIGMERPDYLHRINPNQVAFISTLNY